VNPCVLLPGLLAPASPRQLLSNPVAIAQERAVFEEVETRFCECCAGEAFAAAPAPHACLPPSQLHFFLIVFGFDAQVGCGVVGFSSEVCASGASNDSIAPIHRWRVQLMSRCRRICCVQSRGFRPHALETRSRRCEVMGMITCE